MDRTQSSWGSVQQETRASGPAVWVWRCREGQKHKSKRLGLATELSFEDACKKARRLWKDRVFDNRVCPTVTTVVTGFLNTELPSRRSSNVSCRSRLARITADWGHRPFEDLIFDTRGIATWLRDLHTLPRKRKDGTVTKPAEPISRKTQLHLKTQLHSLAEYAMAEKLIALARNPIELVRVKGGARRKRQARILTSAQYAALLERPELGEHVRTMVQLAMCLGLRASEILGLMWSDLDLLDGTLTVRRSVVGKHQDETKTEASQAQLPLHPHLVRVLMQWRTSEVVIKDWVFGSPQTERPYHRDSLHKDYLLPAAKKIGLPRLGWHDFRHSYRAMLRDLDLPLEVQQKLMRHTSIAMTAQYGGSSMDGAKRDANRRLVEYVVPNSNGSTSLV